MGLISTDIREDIVEVFEDNWDSFLVFDTLATQWRMGSVGPTGLDYNVIPLVLKSFGLDEDDLKEILPNIKVMESEALSVMAEERERNASKK